MLPVYKPFFARTYQKFILIFPPKFISGNRLDRPLAMALLKELVKNDLVDPSYVSLFQMKPNNFQIQIKCDYNKAEIEQYAEKYDLAISEDKERKYLVIYKP